MQILETTSETEKSPKSKPKSKWRTFVWVVLALTVITSVAGALWNTKYSKYRHHEIQYGVTIVDKKSEQESQQSRSATLAKARFLRDRWQKWALANKGILVSLLKAKPTDQKALDSVYKALPDWPGDGGVTGISLADLHSQGLNFTWQPLAKRTTPFNPDPTQRLREAQADKSIALHIKRNFANLHDVELSQYQGSGLSHLSLWASGRITETSYQLQNIPGKPSLVEGIPKELVPPYAFLVSQRKDH